MIHRALVSLAAGALVLAAGPALARTQANLSNSTDGVAAQRGASADANRRICVLQETTGSRLQKRVCRTRAQWERDGGLPVEETR